MAVSGRSTDPRTVAALNKTSGSAAVTAAAGTFSQEDVGRSVTSTGVNAGTTILSVQSATAATLSSNATATNSTSAVLGTATPAATGYYGWSPESPTEAGVYSVAQTNAGAVPPDRITSNSDPKPAHRGK